MRTVSFIAFMPISSSSSARIPSVSDTAAGIDNKEILILARMAASLTSRLAGALIVLIVFLWSGHPALAGEYAGKVVGIADGDTLTLLTADKRQIKVRLAEIDAPESGQPYGRHAKQVLSDLAFGRQARVRVVDRDRYGRDPGLFALEEEARKQRRGLWALPEAQKIPPWEWRRAGRRPEIKTSPASETGSAAFACGSKRTCKDMTSCAEAKFHLNTCGLSRLDSDRDGVPCEALCR